MPVVTPEKLAALQAKADDVRNVSLEGKLKIKTRFGSLTLLRYASWRM